MKILLSLFLFFSVSAFSTECLVVSGQKKDHNGAFPHSLLNPESSMVAGKDCIVFNKWEDLVDHATKNIKAGSDLLVIQGAHGSNDNGKVTFSCNADSPTADDILKHLNQLSSTFRVGSVIDSCYSGEIMRKKLIEDQHDSSLTDRLCLYTSTNPGRISFKSDIDPLYLLEAATAGSTLEDLFLKTDGGMISSAAWSEIGLPEHLEKDTLETGFATLKNIDKIVRDPLKCRNLIAANSALCVSSGVTDEIFEDLMVFMDPNVPNDYKGFFVTNMTVKMGLLEKEHQLHPANKIVGQGYRCFSGILKSYQEYGEKLERLLYWPDIMNVLDNIKTKPFFKDCEAYKTGLKDDWEKDSLYTESFHNGLEEYKKSLDSLKRKYTKTKWDENFDLYAFAQASAGEKRACDPESKQQIISSLFGREFFLGEYYSNFDATVYSPSEKFSGRSVSTMHVMKGFQNATILKKDMPNPLDAKRRKACRDFKI